MFNFKSRAPFNMLIRNKSRQNGTFFVHPFYSILQKFAISVFHECSIKFDQIFHTALEVTKKGKQKQLRNFLKSKQESIGEEVVEREARREDKREERKLERRERDTEGRDEEDQLFEDGDGGVSDSLDRKTDAGFIEPTGAWPNPL